MNEITYLSPIEVSYPVGQKPAKISQEKNARLIAGYKKNLQAIRSITVKSTPVEAPTPVVNEVVSTPVVPQQEIVVAPIVMDNYEEVSRNFQMTGYKKSFDELSLAGARKIRTASKVTKHIKGYKKKLATGMLEGIKIEQRPVSPVPLQEEKVEPVVKSFVEPSQVQPASIVNGQFHKESVSPSVDDYLQKEVPNTSINILIKQQEEKNASLIAEKEAKEKRLQQMIYEKEQRQQQRILEQLKEEELGLTRAIEGLDARLLREQAEMVSVGRGK